MDQAAQLESGFSLADKGILELIRKIEEGDRGALTILYDRTSPLLFGLVLKILGDKARAEETLLDIYTQVWKESATYDPAYSPLEWLVRVARASAIARQHWDKRSRKEPQHPMHASASTMTVAPEQQELARSSLDSLVPMQREILEWAYCSGLSCSEIAAQIGKPVGAVKTHARLGLGRLNENPKSQEEPASFNVKTHSEL